MSTAKLFAPARKPVKGAAEGPVDSPFSRVRPFAAPKVKATAPPKVYRPAQAMQPANPGTSPPSVQLNRIYTAGADGAKGTLQETDSVDFEPPEWCQFFYESGLVFVKSADAEAFQKHFPEAVPIPADDLDEDDEKVRQDEQEAPARHPQELPINPKGDPVADARINKIILRGSRTASQHQELMCVLAEGGGDLCLRFSRNMTDDTAQWNASLSYQALPELETYDVDISVEQALGAFHSAHDKIQAYEQGDCQAFAAEILVQLGLESDTD
jgi:hypothetical protein